MEDGEEAGQSSVLSRLRQEVLLAQAEERSEGSPVQRASWQSHAAPGNTRRPFHGRTPFPRAHARSPGAG